MITTASAPACSRNHRTPAPMSIERVLEEEEGLVAPVAGVPAEEPDAALGQRLGEVVLGEVDVVVGGDAGHPRSRARRPVVEPLARVRPVPGAGTGRRREGHPLPFDGRHAAVTVGEGSSARLARDGAPRAVGLRASWASRSSPARVTAAMASCAPAGTTSTTERATTSTTEPPPPRRRPRRPPRRRDRRSRPPPPRPPVRPPRR